MQLCLSSNDLKTDNTVLNETKSKKFQLDEFEITALKEILQPITET